MDKYKSQFNLPEQQKEEGFSMNEHDFESLGMIKPVKYQAIWFLNCNEK